MPAARVLYAPPDSRDRFLPEGPRRVTVGGEHCLVWVTIQLEPGDAATGRIHVAPWPVTAGNVRSVDIPGRVGFVLPTDRPDLVIAGVEKSLELWDLERGERVETLATLPDDNPRTTLNDAEVVPGGAGLVCGTKDTRFRDAIAGLYLFTAADRRVSLLAGGQTISNGKVFARDDAGGMLLYDIDTPRKCVTRYRFDLANRSVDAGEIAVDLSAYPGSPDGMVDAGDGTAIVAFYNADPVPAGTAVRVNLTTGERLETWDVFGAPRVTCPLLWPLPDGRAALVLTTATEDMPAEHHAACPQAGCLFEADLGARAVPTMDVVRLG